MLEPKRADLRLVDEAFRATAESSPADKLKSQLAASIREGRRREREETKIRQAEAAAKHRGQIEGQAEAHKHELDRHAHAHAKSGLYKGLTIGLAAAVFTALMAGMGGYWISREGMFALVAADRARAGANARDAGDGLERDYRTGDTLYERGRREPPDAR